MNWRVEGVWSGGSTRPLISVAYSSVSSLNFNYCGIIARLSNDKSYNVLQHREIFVYTGCPQKMYTKRT